MSDKRTEFASTAPLGDSGWQPVEEVLRRRERGIVRSGKDKTADESVDSSRILDAARTDKTRSQAESDFFNGRPDTNREEAWMLAVEDYGRFLRVHRDSMMGWIIVRIKTAPNSKRICSKDA